MRDTATRKKDVLAVLEGQGHYWLATASPDGKPHVIGVSGLWDGGQVVVTTLATSRTAKNLAVGARATLAAGDPSDAVVIQAEVGSSAPVGDSSDTVADWKRVMGWDPSELGSWAFFWLRPVRIQAFRGYDEIEGRDVMVGSRWLEP